MKRLDKTYEIVVIDDCSKDRSLELIKDFIAEHPDIFIILRANLKNKGLAQNYIDGAFIGRGKYYRLICGDNSEPVETLVTVFSQMGEADIVVPYYEEFRDRVFYRQFLSKLYTKILNLISGNKIHYYNGLQIHLRYNIMRFHPSTRGFGFQAALLCNLLKLGFTYVEVPTITIERKGGRGDAVTWKNLRSVVHTMLSVFMHRIAP
jgi:glycosyltransferase involved in cell wall biosynthesis